MMISFSFPKQERLKSQKTIERLFSEGLSFSSFPLRLVYIYEGEEQSAPALRFAATVPKKKFPKAVDRNRIRRQVKESFRLEKNELLNHLNVNVKGKLSMMLIYTAPEQLPYQKIRRATNYLLLKLAKKINQQFLDEGTNP